jgi:hypothetical protein
LLRKDIGKYYDVFPCEFADDYDEIALGFTGGTGVSIFIKKFLRLDFEFRYNFDISDSISTIDSWKVRNNSFDIWIKFVRSHTM